MSNRRRIRQRDSEATRRKLLDAVSAIMREQGFAGLRTGAIARHVGRDKNLIRYHFTGLAGLQKAYIREKDYWPPFFERFALSADSSAFDIEQLFSELMQENLRFFYSDVEMQKIILWQISEKNALMRSISDAREADGAKLLDLTDRFFLGTDVNFRAVIALLLGGVYYMVLHANGNGSVVCGIDVHSEKERAQVLRTIGQIVSWSFRQVDEGSNCDSVSYSKPGVGADLFASLDQLASRFLRFVSKGRTDERYGQALNVEVENLALAIEARLIAISDQVQLGAFVRVAMFRLGRLANRFFVDGEDHHAESSLLLSLTNIFFQGFNEHLSLNWVLPRLMWDREFSRFSQLFGELERMLEAHRVDRLLAKAVNSPLLQFFEKKGTMSYGDLIGLELHFSQMCKLLQRMVVSEEELFFGLVSLGGESDSLLEYFKEAVRRDCLGKSSLQVKSVLTAKRARLQAVKVIGDESAKSALIDWLNGELLEFSSSSGFAENTMKFTTALKVTELAYLLKLLYDQGVFGGVKLDVFVSQVGHNFESSSGAAISPGSVKSKFYPKDLELIAGVESLLVSMLEQLRSGRP